VVDVLPTGLSIADGSVTLGGANSANWTCSASSNVITCNSSTAIAAAGSSLFSFPVNVAANASGTLLNKAQVGGGGDPLSTPPASLNPAACTSTGNTPVYGCATDSDTTQAPALSLSKTDGVTVVTAGGTTTYSLTVSNSGNLTTSGQIRVVDVLPTGLSIADGGVTLGGANSANWTCSAASNVITCNSSTAIAAAGSSIFSFPVNVAANASGTLLNKAQVGGGGDPLSTPPASLTPSSCTSTGNTPVYGCATDSDTTQAAASISGFVYVDANNDGVKGAGEAVISGVTVNLTGTDSYGNPVSRTTTTDGTGLYSFAGLAPSNGSGYSITEVQPASNPDGRDTITTGNPGSATSSKPVSSGANDVIGSVVLTSGQTLTNYNYGELPPIGSIAGFVYADKNNNGTKDTGEPGIAGVTVTLTGTDADGHAVSLSTATDANGYYSFGSLMPSNGAGYTITEAQPIATYYTDGQTTVAAGNPGTATSGKPVSASGKDVISGVVLAGQNLTNYNYGEIAAQQAQLIPPWLTGTVYFDQSHHRDVQTGIGQAGWTVKLYDGNGKLMCVAVTDANGNYRFDNLYCDGKGLNAGLTDYTSTGFLGNSSSASGFSIKFFLDGVQPNIDTTVPPGSGTAQAGEITGLTLTNGEGLTNLNLPLDPSGVIYNAVTGKPIANAIVQIYDNGTGGLVSNTCLVGGTNTQTTTADGYYQFDLLQGGSCAAAGSTFTIKVTQPAGYLPTPSTLLPACSGALDVATAPPATLPIRDIPPNSANFLLNGAAAVAASPGACPATSGGVTAGTQATNQYYFQFTFAAGGSNVINNHIPLDPTAVPPIIVTKTTPSVNVARSDMVPYTITVKNTRAVALNGITITDQLPPGFKYRAGSATLDGVPSEPGVAGRVLTWPNQSFVASPAVGATKTLRMLLIVGSGVGDGIYTNCAWAVQTASTVSNQSCAAVRVVPDPTFDCPDVIGKVFDDKDANGYQDQGEPGIPNVRMATPRGLLVTSDAEGRFHVPCPEIPNPDRGSNFFMKLDDRTLPSGYRLTTENPRDVRLTRGKLVKLNFGATIHRVVRIELTDAAFVSGADALLPEWQQRIEALPRQLTDKPSLIRLAYPPGGDPDLTKKRIDSLKKQIEKRWQDLNCCYRLVIETEGE
jgi:uncharacterized repeat protein (TIGR01451 family)